MTSWRVARPFLNSQLGVGGRTATKFMHGGLGHGANATFPFSVLARS
jgi:hypothetical protein